MIATKPTPRILIAAACSLVLVLVPLSVGAQTPGGIIKKGAQGVQKGVETGAEKTKEGAEAVGKGVKKGVTGEDTKTNDGRTKGTETSPGTAPLQSTTGETSTGATATERTDRGHKHLPATAGELPLLALAGVLALATAGALRVVRRAR